MKHKSKMTINEVKKLPKAMLLKIINKAKNKVKKDKIWEDICEKYGEDVSIIDYIPICFDVLDVSARTEHGNIFLNYKLLCDNSYTTLEHYILHECSHFIQQTTGSKPTKGSDEGDYLENPFEQEAFQNQIDYISDHLGDQEAEKYTENLLEHHDINNPKEHEKKKEILMSKV